MTYAKRPDSDSLRIAMLLDDVINEMGHALNGAKHEQLWDEDKIHIEAWREDLISAAKLLGVNL
jgi:hypothetical protein